MPPLHDDDAAEEGDAHGSSSKRTPPRCPCVLNLPCDLRTNVYVIQGVHGARGRGTHRSVTTFPTRPYVRLTFRTSQKRSHGRWTYGEYSRKEAGAQPRSRSDSAKGQGAITIIEGDTHVFGAEPSVDRVVHQAHGWMWRSRSNGWQIVRHANDDNGGPMAMQAEELGTVCRLAGPS